MQNVNFDYEIVIGEDCSTDKTRKICLKYKEKHPRKIKMVFIKLQKQRVLPNFQIIGTMKSGTTSHRKCYNCSLVWNKSVYK